MPFSKRIQERRQKRAADRRQDKLDQRAADELERQKEELRREQARLEYLEMEAALDAAKAHRDELLARLRAQRLAERKTMERKAARQADYLDLIRQAALQANREQAALLAKKERQAEEEKAAQSEADRRARAASARAETEKPPGKASDLPSAKQAQADQEKREVAKKERQSAEQRAAARQASQEERRQADKEREKSAGPGEAARQARLERQEADDKSEAARKARLERLKELHAAGREPQGEAKAGASREKRAAESEGEKSAEQQKARLEERREADKKRLQAEELRAASQAERLAELQKIDETRQKEEERRAANQAARLVEQRQEEEARQKAADLRKARMEERQSADQQRQQADERRRSALQTRLGQRAEEEKTRQAASARRISLADQRQAEAQKETSRRSSRVLPPRNPLLDPLASGSLSGELPWLRTSGSRITSIAGDPILLRGVNLLGLDSAEPHPQRGFAAGAGITPEAIETMLSWGVNVIRVAINRARVLDGAGGLSDQDYLNDLDQIIQQAAQGGAYTLLSLRRLDDENVFGTRPGLDGQLISNFIAPQPGFEHFDMWRILGERYALEPAVLYELYTAPHAPLSDDTSGIESSWDLWTLWVEMSVADLRRVHPGALCFVSGLAGGTDLSGFPLLGTANRPIPNLVYTTHLYPREADPWPAMRALARTHPLFVTEWGGQPLETSWGERAAQMMRASGIGWTAAHWNADPSLTTILRNQLVPSTFGTLVHRALALEGEILAATQPAEPYPISALSFF